MKALTICQPYAELIMRGVKVIENRSWPTSYRGPLLIHAGKSREWMSPGDETVYPGMAFGAIVGRVTMTDCRRLEQLPDALRDHPHANGPWCFVLTAVQRFERPTPYRGAQGLWDVDDLRVREFLR